MYYSVEIADDDKKLESDFKIFVSDARESHKSFKVPADAGEEITGDFKNS